MKGGGLMTVLEIFRTKTVDEIADIFANLHYNCSNGYRYGNVSDVIELDDSCDCPEGCIYLHYCSYEGSYWEENMCGLGDKNCPYNIDRKNVWKQDFKKWLNTTI